MSDPFAAVPQVPRLDPPDPLEGRRPRLLVHVLRAMPAHNAGAERMMHGVVDGLVARGWDARIVAVEHVGEPYLRNGVDVRALTDAQMREPYTWCDVALTHLDVTGMAMAWARYGRPLLHLVHNERQLYHHRVPDNGANAAVWNSEWIVARHDPWLGPQIVCRPPTFPEQHRVELAAGPPTATLVNLLDQKGGPLLWRLARRLPHWRFVGVEGAYGYQTVPSPLPPNGEVVANRDDLRDVWRRTTVCLAPSWYESWGLAAVEALHSGIPVVAHPTPGLRESLGPAGMFVDRDDDDGWVRALTALEHPGLWQHRSRRALRRSAELAALTVADLDRLDGFAREIAGANLEAQRARSVQRELPA